MEDSFLGKRNKLMRASDIPDGEIQRLIRSGLVKETAIRVIQGQLDEEFEVNQAQVQKRSRYWCKTMNSIPKKVCAKWDLAPERFYLAFDGSIPEDHDSRDFELICADVKGVNAKLTHRSSRDKCPWDPDFKSKTCGITYRWVHNLPVTPPLISEFEGCIHIDGGTHRFHLAHYYGTTRMPFLVYKSEWAKVDTVLKS